MIRQNLDKFMWDKTCVVSYNQGVLTILMGDQKGSNVEGDFNWLECSPDIEFTSWFMEWFSK